MAGSLRDHGLEITFHSPFMDLSPGGVDRRVKQVTSETSKVIELAGFFKPKNIVFPPRVRKMEIRRKHGTLAG